MPPISFTPNAWESTLTPAQWVGSPFQKRWLHIPTVFAVRHRPTRSLFFAATSNTAQAYYSWYQRLRGLDLQPPLSPAFRAVYTSRDDFEFIIVEELPGAAISALKEAANVLASTLKGKYPDKCLNMDKTKEEFAFWYMRTPPENRPKISWNE